MLAGAIAGLFAFGFAYSVGEPEIDYAISFEQQQSAHAQAGVARVVHEHAEELVSRTVQAGIGLLTAVVI